MGLHFRAQISEAREVGPRDPTDDAADDRRVVVRSRSGIAAIDALAGSTVTVLESGVDSDGDAYLTVLAAGREVLVYEDMIQLAPMPEPQAHPAGRTRSPS